MDIIERHIQTNDVFFSEKILHITRINKIPLDLNEPSKVLLITFIDFGGSISIGLVSRIFENFCSIEKVSISDFFGIFLEGNSDVFLDSDLQEEKYSSSDRA